MTPLRIRWHWIGYAEPLALVEVLGLITARGGSKAIPKKNVRILAGKPLIAWTIEAASKSRFLSGVIVSTDDEEIAHVSKLFGADVPFMRPAELARDDSPHVLSVEHAVRWLEDKAGHAPDYVMVLQPTSPFRTAQDIDGAIQLAISQNASAVVSVCESNKHPYKIHQILEGGTLSSFVKSDIAYLRRQDLPVAYAENGAIYLSRSESLLRERTFLPVGTFPYIMPQERSLDVDSEWDLFIAELIMQHVQSARDRL